MWWLLQRAPCGIVWIDGKYSWLDDTSAFSNLDGSLINLIVGADYKFTDRFVLGLMGTYETSDLEGSGLLPPTQETDGWGGGAYMGLSITDSIVLSATVLGTELDTDVNGGAADFDSTRVQATSALTGYFYSGTWRYSPSITVAWSKEWQDETGRVECPNYRNRYDFSRPAAWQHFLSWWSNNS